MKDSYSYHSWLYGGFHIKFINVPRFYSADKIQFIILALVKNTRHNHPIKHLYFPTDYFKLKIWFKLLQFGVWIILEKLPWLQGSWGQHGAHLGPTGPRWAPCLPHELCYLGRYITPVHTLVSTGPIFYLFYPSEYFPMRKGNYILRVFPYWHRSCSFKDWKQALVIRGHSINHRK